jgi:DHA2 family metal-tetracycline-proton antiporter-like MFS transporter
LLAGTVALLLLAITNGAMMPAVGCLITFALFVARIRSAKEPFIKPDLFGSKGYSLGLAIAFAATGIGYSLAFLSPQLLTQVHHLAPGLVGIAMVPAAAMTAILGRKAGYLADKKGNPFLFYAASSLLLICFALLSSFPGVSPILVALFLIFGNVGQSSLYIALSNAISRTLPAEQSGVGMGLLAMLNFIAGAVSASLYSKAVDQGAGRNWNPLNSATEASAYGNIYLVLTIAHVGILLLYAFQFGRTARKRKTSEGIGEVI